MEEIKVSVIVPIYNVEKYLKRCLEAIINQTYKNLEIILVDDGAKDSSGRICDEYSINDDRIHVIHKENAGAGIARNVALDVATGDYVTFVDSDDYMDLTMYEKMVCNAKLHNADLVIAGADFINAKGQLKRYNANPFANKNVFESEVDIQDVMTNMLEMVNNTRNKSSYPIDMALWKGLFSRKIIEDYTIRLCSERTHKSEDFIFYTEFVPQCNCIVLMDDRLYYHCDNEDSISHNYNTKVQKLNNTMMKKMLQNVRKYRLSNICETGVIRVYLEATFIVVLDEFRNNTTAKYSDIKKNVQFVCTDEVFQEYRKYIFTLKNEPKKYLILNLMKRKMYFIIYVLIKAQLLMQKNP